VLGKSALSIYQHLNDRDAKSIKQLAQATGRSRQTVTRGLDRLSRYHLAIQTEGGAWLIGPNDLASVASEFGCDALAAVRRNRHAQERSKHQAYVAARKLKGKT
jgi:DeoR/GlpR family transcriptional regulator of sugar metabolism